MVERLHPAVGWCHLVFFHRSFVLCFFAVSMEFSIVVFAGLLDRMMMLFHAIMVHAGTCVAAGKVVSDESHQMKVVRMLHWLCAMHLGGMRSISVVRDG